MDRVPEINLGDIDNVQDMSRALGDLASQLREVRDSMPADQFRELNNRLTTARTNLNNAANAVNVARQSYELLTAQVKATRGAMEAAQNIPDPSVRASRVQAYQQSLITLTQQQTAAAQDYARATSEASTVQLAALAATRNALDIDTRTVARARQGRASMSALSGAIRELLEKIPGNGHLMRLIARFGLTPLAGWAGAAGLIIGIVRRFYELDMAAKKFRENTGLLTSQMKFLAKDAREINLSLADYGVSIDDAYNAQAALYGAFQTTALITKESALNLAKWSVNLGLAVADVAKIKSLFTSISASLGLSIDDTVLLGVHLAKAGGVAPAQVMKDVAESSEAMLMFMAKSPLALVRATVEARRLGTTIKSVAESAKGFLNYQESISSELEASAIVGVNLNFQRARELAFDKKIIQSRKEALRVIEEGVDFTNLSYYAQEQVAKAAQMTAEEIIKMQNQRKMLNALESSGLARDIELTKKWKKALQDVEDVQNGITGDILEQARAAANVADRQARLEMLANRLRAAVDRLTDAFMPLAEELFPQLESFVGYVVDQLNALQVVVVTNADGIRLLVDTLKLFFKGVLFIAREFVAAATDVATLVYAISDGIGRIRNALGLGSRATGQIEENYNRVSDTARSLNSNISGIAQNTRSATSEVSRLGQGTQNVANNSGRVLSRMAMINDQSRRTNTTLSQTERITDRVNRNLQEAANSGLPEALDRVRYNQDEINQSQERGSRGLIWSLYILRAQISAWLSIPRVLESIITKIGNIGVKILEIFKIDTTKFIGTILNIIEKLNNFFGKIKNAFDAIKNSAWVGKLSTAFTKLKTVGGSILDYFGKYAKYIPIFGKLGLAVGRIALFFGKWITPIGWIYTVVEAIYFSFKRFGALFESSEWINGKWYEKIWLGIQTVGLVLYDVLVSPFVKAYEAISDWLGSSPSPLGLEIVDGIASCGKMIFNSLITPFTTAWKKIKEWRGASPSVLGLAINTGIASTNFKIFNSLISPFSQAWKWIEENKPDTEGLYGRPPDIAANAVRTVTHVIETRVSSEVNISGIQELKTSNQQLIQVINTLIQVLRDSTPRLGDTENRNITGTSQPMEAAINRLTDALRNGRINAVMDPRAAASAIATATN